MSNAAATHGKIWERAKSQLPLKFDKAGNLQLPQLLLKFDSFQNLQLSQLLLKFDNAAGTPSKIWQAHPGTHAHEVAPVNHNRYYVNLKVEKKYLTLQVKCDII